MAHNITEEHLHHMARRHHATMKKFDGLRERLSGITSRFVGTLETGAGAWLGGAVEGWTGGGTVLKVPINLAAGLFLLGVGHLGSTKLERWSDDLNNFGNGLIGSYVAATGYAFGKRYKETGKLFGGGGHPWVHPYEQPGWTPAGGTEVHGALSEAQMAAIVQRMQGAAAHP